MLHRVNQRSYEMILKRKMKIPELLAKYRVGIWTTKAEKLEKQIFHGYDKDLTLLFLHDHGKVKPLGRWSIWSKDKNGYAYCIYVCVNKETGGYREPSGDDLKHIVKIDKLKGATVNGLLKQIDDYNDIMVNQKKMRLLRDIYAMSKDVWRQVAQVPFFRTGMAFDGQGRGIPDVIKPKQELRIIRGV